MSSRNSTLAFWWLIFSSTLWAVDLRVLSHKPLTEIGFAANSHLIYGKTDAILVDAQLTKTEASAVAEMVQGTGKNLKAVFITHSHPDHYLGLSTLKEKLGKDFPEMKFWASPATIEGMHDPLTGAEARIAHWKKFEIYKNELPDVPEYPEPYAEKEIILEGQTIQIHSAAKPAESPTASFLYIPSTRALFAGDLIFNHIYLWLEDNQGQNWLDILETIHADVGRIKTVYPGHGPNGDKHILRDNRRYLRKYISAIETNRTREEAKKEIQKWFPESTYRLPVILDISLDAVYSGKN